MNASQSPRLALRVRSATGEREEMSVLPERSAAVRSASGSTRNLEMAIRIASATAPGAAGAAANSQRERES